MNSGPRYQVEKPSLTLKSIDIKENPKHCTPELGAVLFNTRHFLLLRRPDFLNAFTDYSIHEA